MLHRIRLDLIELTLIHFGNKNQIIALLVMNNDPYKKVNMIQQIHFMLVPTFNVDTFPHFCYVDKVYTKVNLE